MRVYEKIPYNLDIGKKENLGRAIIVARNGRRRSLSVGGGK